MDQLKNIITFSDWDGPMCTAVATAVAFAAALNMTLVGSVVFQLYSNVVLNKVIGFGYGDWKLFSGMVLVAGVIAIMSLSSFGQDRQNKTIEILALLIDILMFTCISYFAVMVLIEIKTNRNQGKNSKKFKKINEITTRKILMFVIVYLCEWSPQVPMLVGGIFDYYEDWIYILSNIGLGIGGKIHANQGMLNLFGFMINQKLKERLDTMDTNVTVQVSQTKAVSTTMAHARK
ncbi:hypothetical protein HDV06_006349 [Boothiomyces sp. JEL0866]|nr:hypothetical protein HDV06_006349 [Boothiomyces sp. JEL0866]